MKTHNFKVKSRRKPKRIPVGTKFGMLIVQGEAPRKPHEQNIRYTCLCECGSTTEPRGCDLKDGSSKSCGCQRAGKARAIVSPGEKFHMLTAISAEVRTRKTYVLCECECGTRVEVLKGNLRSGNTKSCGCITRQNSKKTPSQLHLQSRNPATTNHRPNSMNILKINASIAEAERFIQAAKALKVAKNDRFSKYDDAYRAMTTPSRAFCPREQGALRRASMDLTRALADLRKID